MILSGVKYVHLNNVKIALTPAYMEQDPEKKKVLTLKYIEETVMPHAQIIEKHLAENGTGFLVGSEVINFTITF